MAWPVGNVLLCVLRTKHFQHEILVLYRCNGRGHQPPLLSSLGSCLLSDYLNASFDAVYARQLHSLHHPQGNITTSSTARSLFTSSSPSRSPDQYIILIDTSRSRQRHLTCTHSHLSIQMHAAQGACTRVVLWIRRRNWLHGPYVRFPYYSIYHIASVTGDQCFLAYDKIFPSEIYSSSVATGYRSRFRIH